MSDDAVLAVIDAFEKLGVNYMLVGSFSSNLYGIPRSTKDADFVVQFQGVTVSRLARELAPRFTFDPQASFETVTVPIRRILRCVDSPFYVEIFELSDDAHDQMRFQRRVVQAMLGRKVYLPTVEDVIITKLRWALSQGRNKDRDDVADVLGVQRGVLDWPYVHNWCAEHGTRQLLDEILATVPEV